MSLKTSIRKYQNIKEDKEMKVKKNINKISV